MEAVGMGSITADRRGPAVLAVGFGITVAMWSVGYAGRLPALMLPSPLLLLLLLGCLAGGGVWLGRRTGRGWGPGCAAGLVSGALNLLVLGSFLGGDQPDRIVPSALWWIPGSILASALLAGAGAEIGRRWLRASRPFDDWLSAFVRVTITATLLLLAVGGLVTSADAGLAVVDWPTSFGYNMFLYPFSRMTGGIYYEHAHRLFGALVGLTTLVMAIFVQRADPRRWVRRLGWSIFAAVVLQGVLGGLRVTAISPTLALAHGVLGQLLFATLVAMGAFTSPVWRGAAPPLRRPTAGTDRLLGAGLVCLVVCQLVLGAAQRHFRVLLLFHIVFAVALVVPLAIQVGVRAWGLNDGQRTLQRLGLGLIAAVALQIVLGLGAFIVTGGLEGRPVSVALDLTIATAHQWFGAVVLALAVALASLNFRLLAGDPIP